MKPVTEELQGKDVPTKNDDVRPYRHIFTSREIQNTVKEELDQNIKNYAGGFFSKMEPVSFLNVPNLIALLGF